MRQPIAPSFADGFAIVESVLSHAECDRLIEELCDHPSAKDRAGVRNLMRNPAVARLAYDSRLIAIPETAQDRRMIPYKATLFQKTGKANWLVAWHQDTALPVGSAPNRNGWGPTSVKSGVIFAHAPARALGKIVALRIHLDPSTTNNGPLKVIPGSHHERLRDEDLRARTAREPVECLVGKGGIIAMSPLLVHASSKCSSNEPRRVLHIEYAESLEIEPGLHLSIA